MLFILKSKDKNYCEKILQFIEQGDKIVLIQDGVLLLQNKDNELIKSFIEKKADILFLKKDLSLRGVKNNAKAEGISYKKLIELIENNKVFS